MRIVVVGLGKMGLPVAVRLAEGGADVVGVDIDAGVVAAVSAGRAPFPGVEAGLEERLAAVNATGRLTASTDATTAMSTADAALVLVRLVIGESGDPDYAALDAATAALGAGLRRGALVVYETTVPVGDTRGRFVPALERVSRMTCGVDFHVCFSPERVQAGKVFANLDAYPKIVGGVTQTCLEAGTSLYRAHLSAEVLPLSSVEAAEYVKIAENIYRDVNIALANELARYADELGVDMAEVTRAANSQPLSHLHQPGIGVGGHCIPVYPYFLMSRAGDARLTRLARQINDGMPAYACARLEAIAGDLSGRRVLVLGLAFRGDVREAEHSMAVPLVAALRARGAEVRVHDPLFGQEDMAARGLTWGALDDGWAELVVLQADHGIYRDLRPEHVPGVRAIVDGRNLLDPVPWRAAGVAHCGIGRS
jgi:nucleotide sugar dehydrogenase